MRSEERLLWRVSTQGGQSRGIERAVAWGPPEQPKKLEAQEGLGYVPVTGRSVLDGRRS